MQITTSSQIENVTSFFIEKFGRPPFTTVSAPGRINLIGEHTDYNDGFVLPAAVDKNFVYTFSFNDSEEINIYAFDIHEELETTLDNLTITKHSWKNFLIGLLVQFRKAGLPIKGFDCVFTSNVPVGSGMSSSSALECGFLAGLNHLHDFKLKEWQMIDMSHRNNHEFLGVKGGILDQFSSFFGKKDKAMLLYCRSRDFQYVDIDIPGYDIVLINTNVKHDHITGGYNKGPIESIEAVHLISKIYPEVKSMRDVTWKMLESANLPLHLHQRVQFILSENERVHHFADALANRDLQTISTCLYQSHEGLRDLYKVSCRELDLLVKYAKEEPQILGARMMGGGFGGCTINLIKSENKREVMDRIMDDYFDETLIGPEAYYVNLSDGVLIH